MAFGYQHFIVVFNRTGTGDVYKFPIDAQHTHVTKNHPIREEWPELNRLRDYGVAVVDNRVYFLGGYDKEHDRWTDTCKSFNPKTQEWKVHAPMMTTRDKFVCTSIGTKIIVAGGERAEGKLTTASEIYDTETDEWTRSGLLPKGRVHSGACTVGDNAYMSGGFSDERPKDNIWMNERITTWTELDEDCPQRLPQPTAKHCMLAVDDKIYFIGGVRRQRVEGTHETELVTTGATESFTVVVKSGLDPDVTVIPCENTGISEDQETDDEQDDESSQDSAYWQNEDVICPWDLQPTWPDMKHARHSAGAVHLGRRIYVFGGVKSGGGEARRVEYLDLDTRTWHDAGNIGRGNVFSVAAVVLVFAKPEDAEYEMMLEQRRGAGEAVDPHRYKWILW